MKRRLFIPLLIAALVLAMSTVAAACGGGGGELTLEEYFQKLEALSIDYSQRGDALGEGFGEEFATEEEQIKATQDFWEAFIALFRQFVNGIDDLNPPSEVKAAHEEGVDAGKEALKAYQKLVDQVAEAGSVAEMAEGFDDSELETAGDRFTQACVDLQAIADDNGIDVNLDCGDDEG